ncbi:tRNA (guanine(10)-N2)-methyltransferase homolog [Mya arenaria]|uniref:tRNA (guanine(10)-N2)-methyltransferase homolog n=1 Tax=Mya arenaria TaxID=6604 RepID=UPI0022E653EB|nr:tRNA (guanine(10)-N2)-methyltransferase homolog [Mya arenaria]
MAASIGKSCTRTILVHFAHEHTDFRIPELQSILGLFHIEATVPKECLKESFIQIELPSLECARKIASRAVLIRSVYELWACTNAHDDLNSKLQHLPKTFLEAHIKCKESFKYQVTSFNKKLNKERKLQIIEDLPHETLAFEGPVDLKNPQHEYHIIEDYGSLLGQPTEAPQQVYFAKWIADGQREKINEFHLQKRHFIANTSMDAGLSMVMSNLGQVQSGTLIFDPFVGSGSLLVSAAAQGAFVMGADIDYLLLHAKSRPSRANVKQRSDDESVRANLRQYGLESHYIDILVADSSRVNMWREQPLFHSIITDPPYGIREGAKRIESVPDMNLTDDLKSEKHIAQRTEYHLSDIFMDLLNFAARYLTLNGRLVYWFPVNLATYDEANIPTHPCLRLVHNCEQKLNTKVGRRLITMEKVKDFQEGMSDAELHVDHFQESTFRDMYFKESNVSKERNKTKQVSETRSDRGDDNCEPSKGKTVMESQIRCEADNT